MSVDLREFTKRNLSAIQSWVERGAVTAVIQIHSHPVTRVDDSGIVHIQVSHEKYYPLSEDYILQGIERYPRPTLREGLGKVILKLHWR